MFISNESSDWEQLVVYFVSVWQHFYGMFHLLRSTLFSQCLFIEQFQLKVYYWKLYQDFPNNFVVATICNCWFSKLLNLKFSLICKFLTTDQKHIYLQINSQFTELSQSPLYRSRFTSKSTNSTHKSTLNLLNFLQSPLCNSSCIS